MFGHLPLNRTAPCDSCKTASFPSNILLLLNLFNRFHDENHHFIHNEIIKVPHMRDSVGELQAWEMLAAACHQWEWLK